MENPLEIKAEGIDDIAKSVKSWEPEITRTIVESLNFLTREIQDEIPYYDSIIGDDVSGRLPTLFFREIINKKKAEENKEPVQTYFLTSKRGRKKEINEGIHQFISKKEIKKTLVVTEHVGSGYSLKPIVSSLKENNIDYDIVAISRDHFILFNNLDPEIKEIRKKLKFYSEGTDGLFFHTNFHIKKLGGIEKDRHEKTKIHSNREIIDKNHREAINQARKDIALIADVVYKNLENKS
jgi:hypothetical protein